MLSFLSDHYKNNRIGGIFQGALILYLLLCPLLLAHPVKSHKPTPLESDFLEGKKRKTILRSVGDGSMINCFKFGSFVRVTAAKQERRRERISFPEESILGTAMDCMHKPVQKRSKRLSCDQVSDHFISIFKVENKY